MDLAFVDKPVSPILMYCDNQSMLAQVMNKRIIQNPINISSVDLNLSER
jgi:hypothetical protein